MCLTNHIGSISCYTMPLNTHTHTHTHTYTHTRAYRLSGQNNIKKPGACQPLAVVHLFYDNSHTIDNQFLITDVLNLLTSIIDTNSN